MELDRPDYGATDDYRARVLGKICEAALLDHAEGGLLVNYRQLPQALWTSILPHFGVASDLEERHIMRATVRYDAKAPMTEFSADGDAKQRDATATIRSAAEQHLGGIYHRLETLRLGAEAHREFAP